MNQPKIVLQIDIEEERKIEREAEGLVELHDFLRSHVDAPAKDIAKFMPPVDSRAVSRAIQKLSLREQALQPQKKGKLIMTVGIPRSGKTTWAKNFLKESGNAIRVNRDDLRQMLHNGKWTPRNEELTMKAQKAIVEQGLKAGKVVIVDDTNLGEYHKQRWSQIAKSCNAAFEIKHMDVLPLSELIRRDHDSDSFRGADVIVRMALESKQLTFEKDEVVLCDLDGTLCDIEHRRHHVQGEKKNWNAFFEDVSKDSMRLDVFAMLSEYAKEGKKIIFVSARPERCRKDTEQWLAERMIFLSHDRSYDQIESLLKYEALLMRPDGDSRQDTIVKKQMLDKYLNKEWIHAVIDDRPCVIRMWREEGLNTIDVGDGEEF